MAPTFSYYLLPILTSLIGAGGLSVGIHSFLNPVSAASIYGVAISPGGTNPDNQLAIEVHKSYAYCLAFRNFTTGLSIFIATCYWQSISRSNHDTAMAQVAHTALGVIILVGSLVPFVDAYVARKGAGRVLQPNSSSITGKVHSMRLIAWAVAGIWCLLD